METKYQYNTLEDFLITHPLNIDATMDDGWGAKFPIKGIELEATVLFADISGFTKRTSNLTSTETLIFVNNFFSWITAEAIKGANCIVDKYIGDEVMLLFAREFGSDDPFAEAVQTARMMGEHDALSFCPHIGIASGTVTAGYVGTPVKYSASLFGNPVNLASRCASTKPEGLYSTSITFPDEEWGDRDFLSVLPTQKYKQSDGSEFEQPHKWKLLESREVEFKNMGVTKIREIANQVHNMPGQSAEDRAKETLRVIKEGGYYRKYSNEN